MGKLFSRLFGKEEREGIKYDELLEEEDKHETFVNSLRDDTSSSVHLISKIKSNKIKISDLSDTDLNNLIDFYRKKLMYS